MLGFQPFVNTFLYDENTQDQILQGSGLNVFLVIENENKYLTSLDLHLLSC